MYISWSGRVSASVLSRECGTREFGRTVVCERGNGRRPLFLYQGERSGDMEGKIHRATPRSVSQGKRPRRRAGSAPTSVERRRIVSVRGTSPDYSPLQRRDAEELTISTTDEDDDFGASQLVRSGRNESFKRKVQEIKLQLLDKKQKILDKNRRLRNDFKQTRKKIRHDLKQTKQKIGADLKETKKKIGGDIDRSISNMKNNIRKLSQKVVIPNRNSRGEKRERGWSKSSGGRQSESDPFSDEADVEDVEELFDFIGNEGQLQGDRKRNSALLIERWRAWRESQQKRRVSVTDRDESGIGIIEDTGLLDFLSQDGSNIFVRQLQKFGRRIEKITGDNGFEHERSLEGLDALAPELRVLVLTEAWDRLESSRKKRLLRVKPSFVINPLERCLCSMHLEALSCLVRTRTVSELLPGYVESRTGQWWKVLEDDEEQLHERLARAMMNRNFFASLQDFSGLDPCPICNQRRDDAGDIASTDEDAFEVASQLRSLRRVLLEDSSIICHYLASCTRAIIGYRVYACLSKRWKSREQRKSATLKMTINNVKKWPKILSTRIRGQEHGSDTAGVQAGPHAVDEIAVDKEYPEEFVCAICVDLMCKPCRLSCGHSFCKVCLLRVAVIQQAKFISCLCPFCRSPFIFRDLVESNSIVSTISHRYPHAYQRRVDETCPDEAELLSNIDQTDFTSSKAQVFGGLQVFASKVPVWVTAFVVVAFFAYIMKLMLS